MFVAALFIIAPNWKQPKCPSVGEWISKLVYLYYGMLFSNKKESSIDILVIWINIRGIMAVT